MNVDLKEEVALLLAQFLDGPREEDALCNLTELPQALPLVAEAYHHEREPRRRAEIIRCLWEFRNPAALPILAAALHEDQDPVWKEALDGLVALGGDAALRILEGERTNQTSLRREAVKLEWIDEAIGQVRDGMNPG